MLEQPVGTGLDHIRATAVSERAGLSHGAFYHHWASQDDFRQELLALIIEQGRSPDEADRFRDRFSSADLTVPAESFRRAMNESFAEASSLEWRAWVSLLARNDPGIDEMLRNRYTDVMEAFRQAYQKSLEELDLELIPPIDLDQLNLLIDALWEGLAMRATIDPETVRSTGWVDDNGNIWSIYALGVAALYAGTLQRRGADQPSSLELLAGLVPAPPGE
jgi:AcrR family transcriptional regulator